MAYEAKFCESIVLSTHYKPMILDRFEFHKQVHISHRLALPAQDVLFLPAAGQDMDLRYPQYVKNLPLDPKLHCAEFG